MKTRKANILTLVLLLSLPALLYLNSLAATTLWDDESLILDNRFIRDPRHVFRLFSPAYWSSYHLTSFKDYRPLSLSSFILDNTLLGDTVAIHRAVNIAVYSLTCLLLYVLARLLLSSRRIALAAALLFASHPVHVEAVVWLKNRPELLAALLMLCSLISFSKYCLSGRRRPALVAASTLTAILAILSKESALVLPLLICATLVYLRSERRTAVGPAVLIPYFAAGAALYLLKEVSVSRGRTGDALSYLPSPVSRIALAVKTFGSYLKLLILPTDLSIQHVAPSIGQAMDYEFLLYLTVTFAFTLALLASLRRRRFLSFALAWTALCILPVSNLVLMLPGRPVAEQRLFFPSAGFCMALACVAIRRRGNRAAWIALAAITLCYGTLTMKRNADWSDRRKLMEKALIASPGSWKPSLSLSLLSMEKGDYGEAFRHARNPAAQYPALTEPLRHLAVLYDRLGHPEKAAGYYRLALKIDPEDYLAHNGLGSIYSKTGKYGLARREYLLCIRNWPQPAPLMANVGWTYEKEEKFDEAARCYRDAIRSYPDYKKGYCDLGRVLYRMNRPDEGGRAFAEALKIDEAYAPAHRGLGEIELAAGRFRKAREHFGRALALSPGHAETLYSVALSYKREGEYRNAFDYSRRALAADPLVSFYLDSLLDIYRLADDPSLGEELGRTVVEASLKCAALGHPEKARSYLETLLQADHGNREAREIITRLNSLGGENY